MKIPQKKEQSKKKRAPIQKKKAKPTRIQADDLSNQQIQPVSNNEIDEIMQYPQQPAVEQQSERDGLVPGANQIQEEDPDILQENHRNLQNYQQQVGNRGVVYMSRVPPFMTPNYVRKLLNQYGIERIYLLPESQWNRKNRIKRGGSKRICFREGWIEFQDKRMAKMAALTLNGRKMSQKKRNFYSEDLWNLKYLPKFKWHHLTEKLAHEQRIKKQKLKVQLDQQRKVQEYYAQQISKSKQIAGIIKKKEKKGKQLQSKGRQFRQANIIAEQEN